MSLITIAVVGKDNHPLYVRDFESDSVYAPPTATTDDGDEDMDPFGFFENRTTMLNESSSLKNQVRKEILITKNCCDCGCLIDYQTQ